MRDRGNGLLLLVLDVSGLLLCLLGGTLLISGQFGFENAKQKSENNLSMQT